MKFIAVNTSIKLEDNLQNKLTNVKISKVKYSNIPECTDLKEWSSKNKKSKILTLK